MCSFNERTCPGDCRFWIDCWSEADYSRPHPEQSKDGPLRIIKPHCRTRRKRRP